MAKRKATTSNEDDEDLVGENLGNNAAAELLHFIERVERLEEEKGAIASDIKDVYGEIKGRGYDTKAVRKIISERKADTAERLEFESILNVYRSALGMA